MTIIIILSGFCIDNFPGCLNVSCYHPVTAVLSSYTGARILTHFGVSVDITAGSHHDERQLQVAIGTGTHEARPAIFGLRGDTRSHGEEKESYLDVTFTARIVKCC